MREAHCAACPVRDVQRRGGLAVCDEGVPRGVIGELGGDEGHFMAEARPCLACTRDEVTGGDWGVEGESEAEEEGLLAMVEAVEEVLDGLTAEGLTAEEVGVVGGTAPLEAGVVERREGGGARHSETGWWRRAWGGAL